MYPARVDSCESDVLAFALANCSPLIYLTSSHAGRTFSEATWIDQIVLIDSPPVTFGFDGSTGAAAMSQANDWNGLNPAGPPCVTGPPALPSALGARCTLTVERSCNMFR